MQELNIMSYWFQANTLQLSVLLQFNEQTSFTVQQLHENTGIELNYLKQMLKCSLIKAKLLKCSDQSKITDTTDIELNTDFNE